MHLKALLFYLSVALVFFLPAALHHVLAPGDAKIQYLPAFYGKFRLWTDLVCCGFPWFADMQSMTFYPLKALSLLPQGFNLFTISAYILAAFFAYLLCLAFCGSFCAALCGGLVYGFGGFILANLRHTTIIHVMVWLPLALYALDRARQDRRYLFVALLATTLGGLAGHPQMFTYLVVMSFAFAVYCAFSARSLTYGLSAVATLALASALCAVQLLPTAELASFSWRWQMTYSQFVEYSLSPLLLLNFVFPYCFGSFKETVYGCDFFGALNLQTVSGYISLAAFLLIPLAFFKKQRGTVFFATALTIYFLLTLGDSGFLSHIAFLVPGLNKFRAPSRHLMEFTLCAAVLISIGAKNLQDEKLKGTALVKLLLTFGVITLVTTYLAVIFAGASQKRVSELAAGVYGLYPWTNLALALPVILAISTVVAVIISRRYKKPFVLPMLLVLDLASFASGAEYTVKSPPWSVLTPPAQANIAKELTSAGVRNLSLRGNSGTIEEFPVNLSVLYDLPQCGGYENLMPRRLSTLLDMPEGGFVKGPWDSDASLVLDILAVHTITLPLDGSDSRYPAPRSTRFKKLSDNVYLNKRHMPRVWLAGGARIMPLAEIQECVRAGAFDPKQTVLLESGADSAQRSVTGLCRVLSISDNEMKLEAACDQECYLITSDAYYPGWHARVDDSEVEIRPAYGIIRAISLPPGKHQVSFVYRPESLERGILISALAAVLSLFLALRLCVSGKPALSK